MPNDVKNECGDLKQLVVGKRRFKFSMVKKHRAIRTKID